MQHLKHHTKEETSPIHLQVTQPYSSQSRISKVFRNHPPKQKWDKHINSITSKANQSLGFLRRNLKINSSKVKDHAYKAIVRPKLEYSSTVWDPNTKSQIDQIEKVQRRAARFVTSRYHNTSSVTDMINSLNLPELQIRRTRARLIVFYKIIHHTVAL